MEEINIKYPLARQDHLIQHLPQFRIIKRGARQKGVERFYSTKDGKTSVTIRMWKELDIADQDLLLAILAIALPLERGVELSAESEKYRELWDGLSTKGIFAQWSTLSIQTNFYELNNELQKADSGKNNEWILESLKRLQGTSLIIETKQKIGASNFLNFEIDKKTKKINIAINPVSAVVLLGDKKGFVLHNRKERLCLKTTPARALFSILVGLVNQKGSKTLSVPMLIEKMHFINWGTATAQQRKDLKKSFKSALEEINKLCEWEIIANCNDTITIKRSGNNTLAAA